MKNSQPKSILTVALTRHLTGHPVEKVIKDQWAKVPQDVSDRFEKAGFNLDPNDSATNLKELRKRLQSRDWDGVVLAWCIRGHAEYTELFEDVMGVVVEEVRQKPETRLIFNSGPNNLVDATLRNFP